MVCIEGNLNLRRMALEGMPREITFLKEARPTQGYSANN